MKNKIHNSLLSCKNLLKADHETSVPCLLIMLANNYYYTCTSRKAFKTWQYKACKKLMNSISLEDSINYVSLRIVNTGVDSKKLCLTYPSYTRSHIPCRIKSFNYL